MIRTLTIFTAWLLFSNSFNISHAAYSCSSDNKVLVPESSYCCCNKNSDTGNQYLCAVQSQKCTKEQVAFGMKDNNGKKVCLCSITMRPKV